MLNVVVYFGHLGTCDSCFKSQLFKGIIRTLIRRVGMAE